MQARQDEVRQWERDWRETITTSVKDIAKTASDMALIVRGMQSDVKELMEWKASQDKRRDERDDHRPDASRANLAIFISAASLTLYALTFLAAHWKP